MTIADDDLDGTGHRRRDLSVEPLTPNLGVEVRGLAVHDACSDETIGVLRDLVRAHHLVVLPGQILSSDEQMAFTARFGPLTPASPLIPGLDHRHREVRVIDSRRWEGRCKDWHANVTYMPRPPAITTCFARVVPTSGGDTEWASGELAYDALAAPLRDLVDQLHAVHDGGWLRPHLAPYHERGLGTWDGTRVEDTSAVHPVVRVDPATGRRSLFVNPFFTTRIVELGARESAHVLNLLHEHLVRPEWVARVRWAPGTVALWDNQTTVHRTIDDYGEMPRVLHRVSTVGAAPAGVHP